MSDSIVEEEQSWPPVTPMPSEPSPSYSPGITRLLDALEQINALHLTFVGTCSELLTSSQPSTGRDTTVPHAALFASFASYRLKLQDCIFAVLNAETELQRKQLAIRLGLVHTSEPTSKP